MIDFNRVQLINLSQDGRQEAFKDRSTDNSPVLQTAAGVGMNLQVHQKIKRQNRLIIRSDSGFHGINWKISEI